MRVLSRLEEPKARAKGSRSASQSICNSVNTGLAPKVKDALGASSKVLDVVSGHYLDSSTMFDMGANFGGGEILLRVLHDEIEADETRRDRIRRGKPASGDLNRPEL